MIEILKGFIFHTNVFFLVWEEYNNHIILGISWWFASKYLNIFRESSYKI